VDSLIRRARDWLRSARGCSVWPKEKPKAFFQIDLPFANVDWWHAHGDRCRNYHYSMQRPRKASRTFSISQFADSRNSSRRDYVVKRPKARTRDHLSRASGETWHLSGRVAPALDRSAELSIIVLPDFQMATIPLRLGVMIQLEIRLGGDI
jgi:hypothetical protein